MPIISDETERCTVIVTVDAAATHIPDLEAHARMGLDVFPEFPGFVGGALHKSADGRRLVQYLQWESEGDYLACVEHPRWDDLASTRRFMALAQSGAAQVDVRTYQVEATVDGPA